MKISKTEAVKAIGNMGTFDATTMMYSNITHDDLVAYANRIVQAANAAAQDASETNAVHDPIENV